MTIADLDAVPYVGTRALSAFYSEAAYNLNDDTLVEMNLEFSGLPELGPDFVYEGWLVNSGGPITSGRFEVGHKGQLVPGRFVADPSNVSDGTVFVLTIEPRVDTDPSPSKVHILGGALSVGARGAYDVGNGSLTVDHGAALGTDFSAATGSFILATPSSSATDDEANGIWFIDVSSGGPMAGLDLPTLPEGWEYEGWVVGDKGPVSTGRFTSVTAADSDAGGPTAGPNATPPFPGQDFVTDAMSVIGTTIVISVEPSPDDSPAPFAFKPLVGEAGAALAPAVQMLGNQGVAISGQVGTKVQR